MMHVVLGAFLVAHGLVHAIYVGHARRLFKVAPRLTWPDGAWLLSRLVGDAGTRATVAILFSLVAVGFATAGIAIAMRQPWWAPVAVSAAGLSACVVVSAWDGRPRLLGAQGAYALLIDAAIVGLGVVAP